MRRPAFAALATGAALAWLASCRAPGGTYGDPARAPLPVDLLRNRSPLAVQGAVVLQYHRCRRCHVLAGAGGGVRPPLDDVVTRMSREELARRIAEGPNHLPRLAAPQAAALVAFLAGDPAPAR